jgi:PHD/YefM family antitoxin component YafN of YafNO toxin-antitoxin module
MVEPNTGRFVVTRKGHKTGVLLSLKEYRELLEDLTDLAIIAERKEEPSQPFDLVKERLERKWLNTGSK